MSKKKKLTFFTLSGDIFLRDIIIDLRKDYEIKHFFRGDEKEFHQLLHDTDIAWFEFCDQLVIAATSQAKLCKYICRLHSYEMFTDMPSKVDWGKIDKLMFVNPVVHDFAVKKFNIPTNITTVIENGVNGSKYNIPKKKKFNKKIAFVGYMNYKKGPQLLIDAFYRIHKHDPKYTFHIAGDHQDERIKLYFETMQQHLPFKIYWEGWQRDIPGFLRNKDFIISTSLFESFQYGIAEGMLQGCVPLVHNWLGADNFYPEEYRFTFAEEVVAIIKKYEQTTDKHGVQQNLRKHILDNFSVEKQLLSTRKMLEEL